MQKTVHYIRWFETLTNKDVPLVGGKNASLGEMVSTLKPGGIRIPDGFATTSEAYWKFLEANGLKEKISTYLRELEKGKKPLKRPEKKSAVFFYVRSSPKILRRKSGRLTAS